MKKVLFVLPMLVGLLPAQRPWRQITVLSVGEAAANFRTPPHEYGAIQPFLSWNGPDVQERMARIVADLDRLAANGVFVVNKQSLSEIASIENGGFRNLSGQLYRAIVVPSSTVITRKGLERFQAFVKAGGKLIFVGKTPSLVAGRTFLEASQAPDLAFATLIEPSGDLTPRVLAALPKPDVTVDAAQRRLTYSHRTWRDGDMYFLFNEGSQEESRTLMLKGHGQAQVWDLGTGEIHPIPGARSQGDAVRFPLRLAPYETKVIVVGPLPPDAGAAERRFK